jgi:peptide/nickel transport system substrate-binding protein
MTDRAKPDLAHRDQLAGLVRRIPDGTISRREFTRRAGMLGLSSSLAAAIFATYRARPVGASSAARQSAPVARSQAAGATPTPGGTMRFARAEDSTNFDPIILPLNVDIWIVTSVYEQLVRVAANGVDLEPALAASWDISPDGLTYTFHLRPGVKFSDGSDLKASDVLYSLNRARNEPSQVWTFTLVAVKDVAAPDDATVVITLNQPWAPFLADIAMFNSSVIPETWAKGNEARLATEMLGTGPFMLAEWKKEEYLRLTKNPYYWEEGLPLLDEITVAKVPDDNNRILQLQGGEIDAMYDVPFSRAAELDADPNLQVLKFPSSFTQYVVLNHKVEPLDDVNVRLALNYATDKDAIVQVVLFGNGEPATTFMPKDMLFWNDQLPGFPFDLAKAKDYLAKSKAPNGFTLEVILLGGVVEFEQLGATLKDMWGQIGVTVNLSPLDQSVYYSTWTDETYQADIIYWTNDIVDPDEVATTAVVPEGQNAFHTSWHNQEAIDLTVSGRAELDPEKRKQIYDRIQEIYNQDAPVVLVDYKPLLNAVSNKVHDFVQPPTGQWNWKRTWIEQ